MADAAWNPSWPRTSTYAPGTGCTGCTGIADKAAVCLVIYLWARTADTGAQQPRVERYAEALGIFGMRGEFLGSPKLSLWRARRDAARHPRW